MTVVTFGDFLRRADEQMAAATACSQSETADPGVVVGELRRVVGGMARYLEDRVPRYAAGVAGGPGLAPWERAVVDAGTALRKAGDCLNVDVGAASIREHRLNYGVANCLAAAATSLTVGRDLLHTHLATGPDDLWDHRSAWAPVVTSLPVTRALLAEVAGWSRQLALIAAGLVAAHPSDAAEGLVVRGALQGAAWLWEVGVAVTPAEVADPVTADDRRLLQAIPAAYSPGRVVPGGHESVAELCAGITVSAERLRAAVFGAGERARWVPTTADAWRWTAIAAAVTGHASGLVLQSLSGHPGRLGGLPPDGMTLRAAAGAVAQSWTAWRQVGVLWAGLATEARGRSSPVVTEIGDLVLRMGRLAWDDPQWTPERGRGARPRSAADLTAGGEGVAAVVAAVHQAADALTQVAAADRAAVTAADSAGHLYVRTRSLPDGYDVPRPYATPPADRTRPLLDAYQAAVEASSQATSALAALAVATDAPSGTLALARVASVPRPQIPGQDQILPAVGALADRSAAVSAMPGPTEQAIRKLRVKDPAVLLRAVAIDDAGQQLIAQVGQLSGQASAGGRGVPARRRPPGGPARLAAQDSPHRPAAALTSSKPRSTVGTSTRPEPQRPRSRPAPLPGRSQDPRHRHTRLWKTPGVPAADRPGAKVGALLVFISTLGNRNRPAAAGCSVAALPAP
jgi:hypothetical protein